MKHRTYLKQGQTKHMMQLLHSWTDIFLPQNSIAHESYVFQNVQQNVDGNFISFTCV